MFVIFYSKNIEQTPMSTYYTDETYADASTDSDDQFINDYFTKSGLWELLLHNPSTYSWITHETDSNAHKYLNGKKIQIKKMVKHILNGLNELMNNRKVIITKQTNIEIKQIYFVNIMKVSILIYVSYFI